MFTTALERNPDLHLIGVVPLFTDLEGVLGRLPQLEGRRRAMRDLLRKFPDRVAIYGLENHAGVPVYVHAKACIVDDTWATIGRSEEHTSELQSLMRSSYAVFWLKKKKKKPR